MHSARNSGLTTCLDDRYEYFIARGHTVGRSLFDGDMSALVVRIYHFSVARRFISGLGIVVRPLSCKYYMIPTWLSRARCPIASIPSVASDLWFF